MAARWSKQQAAGGLGGVGWSWVHFAPLVRKTSEGGAGCGGDTVDWFSWSSLYMGSQCNPTYSDATPALTVESEQRLNPWEFSHLSALAFVPRAKPSVQCGWFLIQEKEPVLPTMTLPFLGCSAVQWITLLPTTDCDLSVKAARSVVSVPRCCLATMCLNKINCDGTQVCMRHDNSGRRGLVGVFVKCIT